MAIIYAEPHPPFSDFDYGWVAAHGWLTGRDPYQAVAEAGLLWPYFYYPFPAVLVLAPFGLLPLHIARIAFAATSVGVLAYALSGGPRYRLILLVSGSVLSAVVMGQWSPLLVAGALLPSLGALWVAKPSIGAALGAGYLSRAALVGGALLLALSFVVSPTWPAAWLGAVRHTVHMAPVLRSGGVVLLAALLRWRRPEARMVAALACVPHMTMLYETVPLLLVAQSKRQVYGLCALSQLAGILQVLLVPDGPLLETVAARWPVLFVTLWLPALAMVLMRPNVAPATLGPTAKAGV